MGDLKLCRILQELLDELGLVGDKHEQRSAAVDLVLASPAWRTAAEQARAQASDRVIRDLLKKPLLAAGMGSESEE